MKLLQSLEIRASEVRSRLAVIGGMETVTDEVRSEMEALRTEYDTNELRQRALKIAGDVPATPLEVRSSEGRAFRELVEKANVGHIFDAAFAHRPIDGATAEIQQHYGLEANQVPYALLTRQWPGDDDLETRAVVTSPTNVGQDQQSIIPYVFPQSVAAFLGVDMPTVGVGEAVFPVLTSELSVATPAAGAAAAETTGTFDTDVLSPARLQAAFFYNREDRARFAMMDSALLENLSMGLSDGLDNVIVAGTNGLLTGTNLANHNVNAVTGFDDYVGNFGYSRVDGRYVGMVGDVRIVMGAGTYAHAAGVYRNTSVDRTALDRLMDISGGVRVSAHVPAVSGNKQNGIVRRGMNRDMVAPIWEGLTIIPDEVTKAKEGQIVVTAVMLHAVKLLRSDGFYKQQTQHA